MSKEELEAIVKTLTPEQIKALQAQAPKKDEPTKDPAGLIIWDAAAMAQAAVIQKRDEKSFWDRFCDGCGDVAPWVIGALVIIGGAKLIDSCLTRSSTPDVVGE